MSRNFYILFFLIACINFNGLDSIVVLPPQGSVGASLGAAMGGAIGNCFIGLANGANLSWQIAYQNALRQQEHERRLEEIAYQETMRAIAKQQEEAQRTRANLIYLCFFIAVSLLFLIVAVIFRWYRIVK